ncbi:MAG: ABC transporter permease [Micrococcales bacterium]|nr:ABC transporter permease [Micrococcales bacterium]NBR55051.1 ABC transporter permease [Micrococcales bacterium]NBR61671.1 ABC transporter permease [Actinomycetota bacterium]NBT48309.1 ABC transporter permease [Actinomycetota bacterium]NBY43599.1 ABC transporter permease [Micrococcales bacterium]
MAINLKKNKSSQPIEGNETGSLNIETQGLSQGQIIRKKFFAHKPAVIGLIFIIVFAIFVYSASGIHLGTDTAKFTIKGWWKYSHEDLLPPGACDSGCPTADHPFGQLPNGRDYFSLVMRGSEISLMVMVVIGFLGGLIGTVMGAVSGFFGGIIDAVMMRFTDFIITVPSILIGAVIGYNVGNLGVFALALFLGLFAWTGLARLVRGEFLTLREREFVDAARVAGASNTRIIFKHILPNSVGVIIVSTTLLLSGSILLETGLSYLGFGVQAPDVSLGSLINEYQGEFGLSPWLFWWPGVLIVLIALSINFIGDGLRDAFDPRQKRQIKRKDFLAKSSTRDAVNKR